MIERKLNKADIFREKELDKIHNVTMEILEENGMQVLSEKARDIFEENGCRVEGEQVFINRELIEKSIKKAPSQFTFYARNPENNVIIGGDNTVLAPGYGAPFVMDYTENKRVRSSYEDYINFTKLAGNSENIDVVGGVLVEPNDIKDELRHAKMFQAAVKYTDKCLMGSAMGRKKALDSVKMASIVFGGEDYVKEHPVLLTLINTNSPLELDDRMSDALMVYSEYKQAMVIASLSMTGTTAPTTIAGALVIQNAEILTGITLAQLINPGTPVIYGSASSVVDLKTGDLAIGSPETSKMFNGTAQIARYYDIPSRGGGALTDSINPDAQSGYESMMNFMSAVKSGFNFILHSAGLLENYMTMSYEKFMMDDEVCGMVTNFFQGLNVDDDHLAKDVILNVGSSGNYVGEMHTYNHMRDLREPILSSRERYMSNKEQPDAFVRAGKLYKEILDEYEAPELDKEIEKQLQKFIDNIEVKK